MRHFHISLLLTSLLLILYGCSEEYGDIYLPEEPHQSDAGSINPSTRAGDINDFHIYLLRNFDTNEDGSLSQEEIDAVTSINIDYTGAFYDPSHIMQYEEIDVTPFKNLEYLNCQGNLLTSLDVSQNHKLKRLTCQWNHLPELDIRSNPNLEMLKCGGNHITSFNLSQNPLLDTVFLSVPTYYIIPPVNVDTSYENTMDQIDLSNNPLINTLYCNGMGLKSLSVEYNMELEKLICVGNDLESLHITNNPKLRYINCSHNKLTDLQITGAPLLDDLTCESNLLRKLDTSHLPNLGALLCDNNHLFWTDALILDYNPKLRTLSCSNNYLLGLYLPNNLKNLEYLNCSNSHLTGLNVARQHNLKFLICNNNNISELEITKTQWRNMKWLAIDDHTTFFWAPEPPL